MARNALLSALQAAMLAGAGGVQGSIQARERERKQMLEDQDRERRKLFDERQLAAMLRGEQREVLGMGGTPIASAGQTVAGPMPSVIPLTGVGMPAMQAAEAAGGPASSAGMLRQQVGESAFNIPNPADLDARKAEAALVAAIRQAEAMLPFEQKRAGMTAQAAARARAGEDAAEQQRLTKKQEKERAESYQSLKAAGVKVPEPYNPSYRYEDDWSRYSRLTPEQRLTESYTAGGMGGGMPSWRGPTATPSTPAAGSTFKSGNKTFILPE